VEPEEPPGCVDAASDIERFLYQIGAGTYDFEGADGAGYASARAAAWWALRDYAAEDFTEYMEDKPASSCADWESDWESEDD
jgi:hypothetical protein